MQQYQLFLESIRSPETKKVYTIYFKKYVEFMGENENDFFCQKKHYDIIEKYAKSPSIQLVSLAELDKLNITLSNYFDVAPAIISPSNISIGSKNNDIAISDSQQDKEIIL